MPDSQLYPLNLNLLSDVKEIVVFSDLKTDRNVAFGESRNFVVSFWLDFRPPEGILFYWRGLKLAFNNL